MLRISYKQPQEVIEQEIDFRSRLSSSGASLSWVGTSVEVIDGTATDTATLIQSATASASVASLVFQQGTHDNVYMVRILVSASVGGDILEEEVVVPVWNFGA